MRGGPVAVHLRPVRWKRDTSGGRRLHRGVCQADALKRHPVPGFDPDRVDRGDSCRFGAGSESNVEQHHHEIELHAQGDEKLMSLLFADSFDHYPGTGAGKWYWGGGGAIVTSPVRTGARAMGGGSNGPAYYPGTLTHFIVGVGVCFGSAPSATHYASFTDNSGGDSNVNLYLSAAADGSLGLGCSWGYGAY